MLIFNALQRACTEWAAFVLGAGAERAPCLLRIRTEKAALPQDKERESLSEN